MAYLLLVLFCAQLLGLTMQTLKTQSVISGSVAPETLSFYCAVLEVLNRNSLPYLVGGAYALNHYAGINRDTKDFDIFITRDDYGLITETLARAGYATELTYPHWLGKVHSNGVFIDLVFSSGNGIAEVDEEWFEYAAEGETFGIPTKICPPEEMLWSKAFIMERERFDGADVAHLILARGAQFDWLRLLRRFDGHWRLLLSHLILFGFIYPGHKDLVPAWVMNVLLTRLQEDDRVPAHTDKVCAGTLLSREQYLNDINGKGYQDPRVEPGGTMSPQDTAKWTEAIWDR